MSRVEFEVQGTWDGGPLEAGEFARTQARVDPIAGVLVLDVEASYFGDPVPQAAPGSVEGLWEFEVVELFLLGDDERYLEIELGPHGHYLGLTFAGRRRVVESGIPIEFSTARKGSRWSGEARILLDWLPPNVRSANFYAIHGRGSRRRYLATFPAPGPEPDFHRLESFEAVTLN